MDSCFLCTSTAALASRGLRLWDCGYGYAHFHIHYFIGQCLGIIHRLQHWPVGDCSHGNVVMVMPVSIHTTWGLIAYLVLMPVTLTSGGLWLWLCTFPYTPLGGRGHSGIMRTWAWALCTWSSCQSWVGWASTVMHTFIHTHLLILALCGLCVYGCLHCTLSAHAGDWGVRPSVMHIVIYTTCDLLILAYRGTNGYVLSCMFDYYSVTHTIEFLPVMHPYTILMLLQISPSHVHPHAHFIHHYVQLWLS